MKFKGPFTFILIPKDYKKVFKHKFSSFSFWAIVTSVVLVLSLFFILTYNFFYYKSYLSNYDDILSRNRRLNQKLYTYKKRIDNIEKSLERINIITSKLKIISNLSDPDRLSHVDLESEYEFLEGLEDFSEGSDIEIDNEFLSMQVKLRDIENKVSIQEEELTKFSEYLSDQSALLAATPSLMPVKGWLTSGFGMRRDPFTRRLRPHHGIDIATRIGTPIVVPANGVVVYSGTKPGYGLVLVIDHGYGITTRYGHCSRFYVSQGVRVKRGMPIAAVGNTGRSTGPHLHYEVRINGVPVNPKKFILDDPWSM